MTSRLPYDGGRIERTRSEKYKKYADKTRYTYPDVASIFDSLSRDHEYDAHRMDNQAELDKNWVLKYEVIFTLTINKSNSTVCLMGSTAICNLSNSA